MAILKGKDGTVSIASASVGNVSSWSVSIETDTLETTAMGTSGWKTFAGSLQSWSGSVEVYLESGVAPDDYATGTTAAVVLEDGSSGNTYTGTAIVTSASVDVGVADLVTMTLDLTGDGALVIS